MEKRKGKYRKVDLEEFKVRSSKIHGGKYGYDLVIFNSIKDKVTIFCNSCNNSFIQTAKDHLAGCGCKVCGIKSSSNSKIKSKSYFISMSEKVHGNRYDYSLVEYTSAKSKVRIICKDHGIFEQCPNSHYSGQGCPLCAKALLGLDKRKSLVNFSEQANITHDYKYDYSCVEYVNGRTPVTILCREHGEFRQSPENHLSGQGCPSCAVYGYNPKLPCSLYVHRVGDKYLKFGITRNITRRLSNQRLKCKYQVFQIFDILFESSVLAKELEDTLKLNCKSCNLTKAEMPDGYTETTDINQLSNIEDLILEFFTKGV